MNITYRSVWCEKTQTYVAASELAKGRTKRGKVASAAISILLGSLGGLASSAHAAMVINGNPQEASPSCESMSDGGGTAWTVSTSAGCQVGALAGTASGQGNPGQNAVFYSSSLTNGKEDSLNLGGYLDVWKTATFHAGLDLSNQKITGLANGTAATDAATFGQLTEATKYFHINSTLADASTYAPGDIAIGGGASAARAGYSGGQGDNIAIGTNAIGQGNSSIAIGHGAATNTGSLYSGTTNATAIGTSAYAEGWNATAIGDGAKAGVAGTVGTNYLALGSNATALAAGSVALGGNSVADRANSVSIGKAGSERQIVNVAKGTADTDTVNIAQLKGITTALGGGAAVNADGTIKAPSYTLANANTLGGTTGAAADVGAGFTKVDAALGALSTTANKGFNVSADAGATSQNVAPGGTVKFAAGSNATVSRSGDTITYSMVSNPTFSGVLTANGGFIVGAGKTIDMGGNKVTNVAAGSASTDAVNKGQLDALNTIVSKQGTDTASGLGGAAAYNPTTGAVSAPSYLLANANTIGGTTGAAADVGAGFAKVDGALGKLSTAATNHNRYFKVAGGANDGTDDAKTGGAGDVAIGRNASATYNNTVAIGEGAQANYNDDMAVGAGAVAGGGASVAVGTRASAIESAGLNYQTVLGTDAKSEANQGTVLGGRANAKVASSVALGADSVADRASGIGGSTKGAVSVGSGGAGVATDTRQIISVARGTQDTDAINLSQLKGVTTALGGSAAVNADGTIKAPNYTLSNANTLGGTTGAAADVGAGFTKVDAALGALSTTANKGFNVSADAGATSQNVAPGGTVKFAAGSNATVSRSGDTITYSMVSNPTFSGVLTANGGFIVGAGKTIDMGGNKVTNVAAGSAATDAVNKGQLDALNTIVSKQGTDTASGLGGGAAYNATTGAVSAPSYTLANANTIGATTGAAADVGAGFTKVDAALGALSTTANKGFNVSADAGTTSQNVAPGGTVKFAAGSNATVSRSGDTITYSMVSNPTFSGVLTANGGFIVGAGKTIDMGGNKVTNVAAGSAATDAVNKGQLDALNTIVSKQGTDTASGLGGGAAYNAATGAVSAPSYLLANANTIGGTTGTAADVGTGFSKVDTALGKLGTQVAQNTGDIAGNTTSINTLQTTVNNINGGKAGLVQQSAAGANLSVGKATDGAAVDFLGTAGARKLINVADGSLAANSKDAVNGGQLFSTNQQVAQNTSNIAGNTTAISNLDSRVTTNEGDISTLNTSVSNITNQISGGTVGLVQQSAAGANLTVGKATDGAAVDFLGTAGARKLINVADGSLAANSKDAVNGGQLFSTNQQVAQNTSNIAGNTAAITNLDGRVTQNTTSITNLDGRVTTNEGSISTLNTSVSNITNQISGGTVGLVQQSSAGANLTVGKATDGAAVDFLGTTGARKLVNVADGALSANSKDAVNGGQLFSTNQQVAQNTSNIAGNTTAISNLDSRVTNNEGDISTLNTSVSNIDARVTQNSTDIAGNSTAISNITNQISGGTVGLVQQSAAGENLTVGKDTDGAAVDFLGTTGARKLINVADGSVAANSKEAVNGGQLFATNQQVAQNTSNIAGHTTAISNLDSRVTTNEGDISTLNTSVSNIDARVTQNSTDIAGNSTAISNITNQINSGTVGLVQQSAAGENLTVGKDTDGAAVDFLGTAGARKLINVADGSVSANSKEAVNGGQLFTTNQAVAQNTTDIAGNTAAITNLDDRLTTNEGDISTLNTSVSNIDGRVTQNTTDINTINSTITSMSGQLGDAVMYDGAAHDKVTLGAVGKAVQLTNLKAGGLSADSTDAVNGAQLFDTNNKVAVIDGRVSNLEGSVTNIVNGGGIKFFHVNSTKADAIASGAESVAMGGAAKAGGDGSVAIGDGAQASGKGSVAVGQGANDNGRGAESYSGKYSGEQNDTVGTVAVGNAATGQTRTISGVADGKEGTDAVNLRQLDGAVAESKSYTDKKVSEANGEVANSIAQVDTRMTKAEGDVANLQNGTDGMAQVNNTSKHPKPKSSGDDSAAFGAGSEASGNNSVAMGSNAKARGKNSAAIGANSVADRDNTVAVGSAGNERQITHVAAGTERSDAVNLGQVSDALGAVASQSNNQYNSLKRDLDKQNDELSAGIAGAIAIASLSQPMVNGGSTTAAGLGTYNGQSAVSVGVSHISNDGKWTTKLGGSTDTQGNFSAGASVGYNW